MTDKQADYLQEQLIATRRTQILEAATTLFAEKGFARTTIKEIAQAAGLAEGTIYLYFKNKDALLLALLDQLNESERRAVDLAQAGTGGLEDFMRSYLAHRLTHMQQDMPLLQALLGEMLINNKLGQQYYEQIIAPTYALGLEPFKELIARGQMRDLDPALTVRAIPALVLGLLMLQLLGDTELENRRADLPDFIAPLLFKGLNPEPPHDHD